MISQSRQIFKNTLALTVAFLFNKGGSFVLTLLISRAFHASGLGIYSAAIAYYDLIALAGGMGAKDFLVREIAKDTAQVNHYVIHAGVVATASSIVLMALFALLLPHLGYSAETMASLAVVILAIVPGALHTIQDAVFIAHQRVAFITYTRFVTTAFQLGLSVYLMAQGHGITSLVAVFVATEYLVVISYFYLINRYIAPLRWVFQIRSALKLAWEMRTFTALSLLASLFVKPEVIILSLFYDEAQVGYYSAAIRLVSFWYFVSQMYMTNVYPVLSRSYHLDDQSFQVIMDKSIKYLLAISLPLAAGIVAAAGPIIELLYGPGFETAAPLLQILAWNIPLAFVSAVLWRALAARDRQNAVLSAQVVTLFTRLGGGVLLISWLSSLGAAIIAPVNLLLNTLLLGLATRREGIRPRFVQIGWRFALAATAMGGLTWVLGPQFHLGIVVIVAAIAYAALIVLLRAFSPDDIALFRQIWRPQRAAEATSPRGD